METLADEPHRNWIISCAYQVIKRAGLMAATSMWMVKAGEGGRLFEEFRKDRIVAIGWNEMGDLSGLDSQEDIRQRYLSKYPGEHPAKVANAVAMIFKFRAVLQPGQKVTTYNRETREYLVGTIAGEYEYSPNRQYPHVRSVDWSGCVDRDSLKASSRNSLGGLLALIQLNDETADDLRSALDGKPSEEAADSEEKEELGEIREDIWSVARPS